jgi:Protein of unknown function (DUF3302)
MLGFELDFWDYVTFASLALAGVAFVLVLLFIGGLPGRIAVSRNHPEAEAVTIMGWAGFLAVVPWMQAFIWAFKPTDVVDIRRFPREEAKAIEEENRRLRGEMVKVKERTSADAATSTVASPPASIAPVPQPPISPPAPSVPPPAGPQD